MVFNNHTMNNCPHIEQIWRLMHIHIIIVLVILPFPGMSSESSRSNVHLSDGFSMESGDDATVQGQQAAASGGPKQNVESSNSSTGSATSNGGGILSCIPLHAYPAYNIYCVLKFPWRKHVLLLCVCGCFRKWKEGWNEIQIWTLNCFGLVRTNQQS